MSYLDPNIHKKLTPELLKFLDTDEWREKIIGSRYRKSQSCIAMMLHYFEYLYTNETTHEDMLLMANRSNGSIWERMLSSDPKHQILTQAPINDSNGNRIGGGFGCDRRQFNDQVLSAFRIDSCFFVPPSKPTPSALSPAPAPVPLPAFSVGINDGGRDTNKKKAGSRKNQKAKTYERQHEEQELKKTVSRLKRKILSLRQSILSLESRESYLIQSAKLRAAKDKEERRCVLDSYLQNFLGGNEEDKLSSNKRHLESILAMCHPSDFDVAKTNNDVLQHRILNQLLDTDTSVKLGALIRAKLEDNSLQEKKQCQEDSLQFANVLISCRVEVESNIDRELKLCALVLQLCASHRKTVENEKEEIKEIDTRVQETVAFLENLRSSYSDFVTHAKLIKFAADDQVFHADITSDTWIQIFSKINRFSNFHLPLRTVQLLKKRLPTVQLEGDVSSELGSYLDHLNLSSSSSSRMRLDSPPDQVSFMHNMSSAGSQDSLASLRDCRSTRSRSGTIHEDAPAQYEDSYRGIPGPHQLQQIQKQGMILHATPVPNTKQHEVQQQIPGGQFIPPQQQPSAISVCQHQSQFGTTNDGLHLAQQQGAIPQATSVNQHQMQQQIPDGHFISGNQSQSQFGGTTINGQQMTQQQQMIQHVPPVPNTNQHQMQQQISDGPFMLPQQQPAMPSGGQYQFQFGSSPSIGHQVTQQQGIISHAPPVQNTKQPLLQQIPGGQFMRSQQQPVVSSDSQHQFQFGGATSNRQQMTQQQGKSHHAPLVSNTKQPLEQQIPGDQFFLTVKINLSLVVLLMQNQYTYNSLSNHQQIDCNCPFQNQQHGTVQKQLASLHSYQNPQ
ncbi:hypothetical protein ACHAWX_005494, partial [Stephanocyclus meneghinianus]